MGGLVSHEHGALVGNMVFFPGGVASSRPRGLDVYQFNVALFVGFVNCPRYTADFLRRP